MPDGITRSELIRGLRSHKRPGQRPPWAQPEARFTDLCQRCDACIRACPEGILVRGRGGFPEVDFRYGECTFCGACRDVCRDDAFRPAGESPWSLEASIDTACLAHQGVVCRLCEEQCEPRAIRFKPALGGQSLPSLDETLCTGCGACVAPCPVDAITIAEPLS